MNNAIKLMLTATFVMLFAFAAIAQTPSPQTTPAATPAASPQTSPTPPGQTQAAMTFAESLQDFTDQAIIARQLFINQVEKPLSGWFYVLAQMIALIMFGWAIAQFITTQGGFTAGDITRIGLRCAVGFLLLFFAGDVDGDGVRGDLVNYPASVGYYYAYGVSKSGQVEGSFLNREVTKQETKFNEAYQKFTENKLMVRVSGRDMPVQYPTMQDVNLLSSLYTGKPLSEAEIDEAKSRSWQMGMLFGSLNFSRGILAFADFYLFFISGFAVLVLRLALPLMIGAMFHKEYGQKMTVGFFWSAFVWTIVFPGMTQFLRMVAYSAGNVAMGLGGDNPYYTFDPTSGAIVSNGHPEGIVVICSLYMLFASLCMFAAPFLATYLTQGKILEGIIQTTSAWFTAATSIGVSMGTGAIASRMSMQADQVSAKGQHDASLAEAGFQKTIAENSAKNSQMTSKMQADSSAQSQLTEAGANKKAEDLMTNASYQNASIGAYAGYVDKVANAQTEQYQSKANALMNLKQDWMNLDSKEKQERLLNGLDFQAKNGDAYAKELVQAIKDEPERLNLLKDQLDQYLNGVPVVGSALKTVGINGDALNTWLRTDAGKTALGTMLTGGTNPAGGILMQNMQFDTGSGMQGIFSDKNISKAMQDDAKKALEFEQNQMNSPMVPQSQPGNFSVPKAMTSLQKQNLGKLKQLMAREPDFMPAMQKMCARNGWNPDDMLNLMALETANTFNKSIRGGGGNDYVGLIQFGEGARKDLNRSFGTPTDVVGFQKHLQSIPASQQLRYVESYLKARESGGMKLDSAAKMYAAVGAGSVAPNDNMVIFRNGGFQKGDFGNTRKISNAGYDSNAAWDFNKDGVIQQWEFGAASHAKLGAGTFFTANKLKGDLAKLDPATIKVVAPQVARQFERDFQLEQNKRMYEGKEVINQQYYGEQRQIAQEKFGDTTQIAENVYGQRTNAAQVGYNYAMQGAGVMRDAGYSSSNIRYQGKVQAVEQVQESQHQVSDLNFNNEMKNAALAYESRSIASEIQYKAANESSHLRALGQMYSNIGSNVGHHIAEATEKFSRY